MAWCELSKASASENSFSCSLKRGARYTKNIVKIHQEDREKIILYWNSKLINNTLTVNFVKCARKDFIRKDCFPMMSFFLRTECSEHVNSFIGAYCAHKNTSLRNTFCVIHFARVDFQVRAEDVPFAPFVRAICTRFNEKVDVWTTRVKISQAITGLLAQQHC